MVRVKHQQHHCRPIQMRPAKNAVQHSANVRDAIKVKNNDCIANDWSDCNMNRNVIKRPQSVPKVEQIEGVKRNCLSFVA